MKILKWIGSVLLALLVLAAAGYLFYGGPIGQLPGKRLRGEEAPAAIRDWSFSDNYRTIAVETRPGNPHSVTTLCISLEGRLYIPARNGSEKKWTRYVLDDPRVRVRIGNVIYPGLATRVEDETMADALLQAARIKYPRLARSVGEHSEDIWVFRVDSQAP